MSAPEPPMMVSLPSSPISRLAPAPPVMLSAPVPPIRMLPATLPVSVLPPRRRARPGQPALAGVVLVALTGYGAEEDRRQAQAAGFDHHMVKPVNFDTLQELLSTLEPHDAGRL
jgi:hypothetical protein